VQTDKHTDKQTDRQTDRYVAHHNTPDDRCSERSKRKLKKTLSSPKKNKTVVDSGLRPWCAAHDNYLLAFIVDLVEILAIKFRNTHDAPYGHYVKHDVNKTGSI